MTNKPNGKLKPITALALKRYKVGVKKATLEEFTVYAHDRKEAAHLVVKRGQGRSAGRIGPNVEEVFVKEIGGLEAE